MQILTLFICNKPKLAISPAAFCGAGNKLETDLIPLQQETLFNNSLTICRIWLEVFRLANNKVIFRHGDRERDRQAVNS